MRKLSVALFLVSVFIGCGVNEAEETAHELSSSPEMKREKKTMNRKTNRLINETSPYLKQHAHNPVDWYPWSEEAIQRAVEENKPILVSIGYSSCHWCHVMAHEVFENVEIAALMNKYFICIKVDREERPDLDKVYMNFVQAVYGSGGWPLNVFLTPELIPFFGGTYFPPEDALGRPGFKSVLMKISDFYRDKGDDIRKTGAQLAAQLSSRSIFKSSPDLLSKDKADEMLSNIYNAMDLERGGFGRSNKFPQTTLLSFLLQNVRFNPKVTKAVRLTLDNMANRGLYDHLGGGFHRYSVDPEWWVPHFEKMLYDNALIPVVYLEAYQLWGTARYREVVEETLDFVLRDMTGPQGGFYSALDADSDGEEGKFYVWNPDEIKDILGENIGEMVKEYYGVAEPGNFEKNKSVLIIERTIAELSQKYQLPENEMRSILKAARGKLLGARENRVPPAMDDKNITAWNGMMIHTLVKAYQVLGVSRYLQAAEEAVGFIEKNMERNGRYYRTPISSKKVLNGYISDYAFMVKAYISLFEVTGRVCYLNKAEQMTSSAIEYFWDRDKKGFFFTSHDHGRLFTRIKEAGDGVVPSGNSVFAHNFLRLYAITIKKSYYQMAVDLMKSLGAVVEDNPMGAASWLTAYYFLWNGNRELVLVGLKNSDSEKIFRQINRKYLPNKVIVWLVPNGEKLPGALAAHKGKKMLDNLPTLYICQNFTCLEPLNNPKRINTSLDSLSP